MFNYNLYVRWRFSIYICAILDKVYHDHFTIEEELMKANTRENWLDYTKLLACILVVLGHFYQSMVKANIVENNMLYLWFCRTIYYFHVPLFFICSGYLYQRYTKVDSGLAWKRNINKKLVTLGIPYVLCSMCTWMLKLVFSRNVNTTVDDNLMYILLLKPISPYWYLYALIIMMMAIPTMNSKKGTLTIFISSALLKILALVGFSKNMGVLSELFGYIAENQIWFASGMLLAKVDFRQYINNKLAYISGYIGLAFIILTFWSVQVQSNFGFFGMGCLACFAIITTIVYWTKNDKESKITQFSKKYSMAIFLLHTICAALVRSILMCLGINDATTHIVIGLAVSFIGPILIQMFITKYQLKKLVWNLINYRQ